MADFGDENMRTVRRRRERVDDDNDMVPDGGRISVRMDMMDSVQLRMRQKFALGDVDLRDHQRGYRVGDHDVQRRRLQGREEYVKNLGDAWRNPGRVVESDTKLPRRTGMPVKDARAEAYDQMVARLTTAWRTPSRDAQPDLSSTPEELLRYHMNNDPDDDDEAEAIKNRAYELYRDRISNAWKNPGISNPTAAGRVEAIRKKVTNE
jgi:hypothetical protein